jgi:hypothetical protein
MKIRTYDSKMKIRPIITRMSMWPASMLAKSRTEREIRRMNCEMTSSGTMRKRSGPGAPCGTQLLK